MYKFRAITRIALLGALLGLSGTATAGTPINERHALNADGRLTVKNIAGSIEIRAWDRNEVQISGSLGRDAEKLEIGGNASALKIEVRYPRKNRGGMEETQLRLQVPAGITLEVEAVSADVRVIGTRGPVKASSVSGDVSLDVGASRVEANSVSGDVHLRASSTDTRLASVSGDLRADGVRGTLKAETVSGDLEVAGGPFKALSAESVSGDLQLDVSLDEAVQLTAETLSGDIALLLPKAPDARVVMKTFSGELRNRYDAVESGERRNYDRSIGSGKGSIKLNSFSGDIMVSDGKR